MTEEEALLAVSEAKDALALALDALRSARGESADEPCPACEGDCEGCLRCSGTGFAKKRYPWIITGVKWDSKPLLKRVLSTWVKIRPCAAEFSGKTYLGWLLGDMALSQSISLDPDGTLVVSMAHYNPAIFVPDLDRVVFGRESWWGAIRSPSDLVGITDADISNVWYMKALADLETTDENRG